MKCLAYLLSAVISISPILSFAAEGGAAPAGTMGSIRPPVPTAVPMAIPAPPMVNGKAWVLIDFQTGQVLAENNSDQKREPASLTKMMTIYTVAQALKEGHIHLTDQVPISEKAWKTGGSRMFVEVGKKVELEQLMKGDMIDSGNDASVALAEYVSGSEDVFAQLMNQNAARLGMTGTHFVNSTGLPVDNHYTTARDLGRLAIALIRDFPDVYKWFSIKEFTFNGITQHNRNKLLWEDNSVDGIKTGFHDAAGYCLVASAVRNGMRLIAVVMGADSPNARAESARALLNYGFRFYETDKLYGANQVIKNERVWKGAADSVPLGPVRDIYLTYPRGEGKKLKAAVKVDGNLIAPLKKGEQRGTLEISLNGKQLLTQPLVVLQDVPTGSFVDQMVDSVKLLLK
jgi:D-alanyl-D-alanine carboxypeptidase (penicillin-binding protein 5/6)